MKINRSSLRTFVFSECNWLFWSGRFYGFWWVVQLLKSSCSLKTLKRCPRGHARVNLFLEKSYIHTVLESGSHGQPDAWQFWSCRKSRRSSESRWLDKCSLSFYRHNPAQTVTVKKCNANYDRKNRNFRFWSLGLGWTTGTSVYSLLILKSSKYYEDGTHVYR